MVDVRPLPEKWLPISIAPLDTDLAVGVRDKGTVHKLVFPVCKNGTDWVDSSTKVRIDIRPTHWRNWTERD
jgi:hypothetical protein